MRILKKFPIHPSFLLLFLWFVITRNLGGFFIFLGVVLTHEFGHYFVAKRLGYKLDAFFIAPYGVSLNYKEKTFESSDEVKIALAGPMVNLFLALTAVSLWWIFPEIYSYTEIFVQQSVFLALFNLIPAYPLDGGRLVLGFMTGRCPRKKVIKILLISNLIFSLLFFILFVVSCVVNFNPTFALASCFMLGGILQTRFESKYEKMSIFKKKIKSFSKPYMLVVNTSATLGELLKHVEPNKYTVFYVVCEQSTKIIDEKTLLRWSLVYPYNIALNEILKIY